MELKYHREPIKERDRLTGEFRKLIKYAEPHVAMFWSGKAFQQHRRDHNGRNDEATHEAI